MAREEYKVHIHPEIRDRFREHCKANGHMIGRLLETLMLDHMEQGELQRARNILKDYTHQIFKALDSNRETFDPITLQVVKAMVKGLSFSYKEHQLPEILEIEQTLTETEQTAKLGA